MAYISILKTPLCVTDGAPLLIVQDLQSPIPPSVTILQSKQGAWCLGILGK